MALNLKAELTNEQAIAYFAMGGQNITAQCIYRWRVLAGLKPVRYRRRKPLYLLGDLLKAEAQTREKTSRSHRQPLEMVAA